MKRSSYITFRLGRENFALPVTHVREVLDLELITPLPLCPAHVRGVVKVRDEAVPVIDLRTRFGMPPGMPTLQTRIIVMEFMIEGKSCVVGGLADAVQEVIELEPGQISPPPSVGSQWKAGLIEGITLREGAFVLLLNVETLFSGEELQTLVASSSTAKAPLVSNTMHEALQEWQRMPQLSEADFMRFAKLVTDKLGIRMPRVKRLMVQSRLISRLRDLEMDSFSKYLDYLLNSANTEQELRHFFDLITTNKTDFFREPVHFDFVTNEILPRHCSGPLQVWSAGCASGEEAYTIAIVLGDHALCHPGFSYSILATDISQRILTNARDAIYTEAKIEPIPMVQRKRYLLRGKNSAAGTIRIGPELRERVRFKRLNLMDECYALEHSFDLIFFRNVMIYFDRDTQMRVLANICQYLRPGGHLFISLTESIIGGNLPLIQIAPSVFRKRG